MNIKNLVASTTYLEFIGNLDKISYEFLYGENGFTKLSSKDAIQNAQGYIDKYKNEARNLAKNLNFEQIQIIIDDKVEKFSRVIEKYYVNCAYEWAFDIYSTLVDNFLLQATIYKNDSKELEEIYAKAMSLIAWLKCVKNLSDVEERVLIDKFNLSFNYALKSDDSEFISKNNPNKSDFKIFLDIFEEITKNPEIFIEYDLNLYLDKLSKEDFNYFIKIQKDLKTYKRTKIVDEFNLIQSAIEILSIKKQDDKFIFIKKIFDDLNLLNLNKAQTNDEDIVKLVKRRMNLYKNSSDKNGYYKNLLTSLNV